jgi:V-type H+-transporting ATPase subunit a
LNPTVNPFQRSFVGEIRRLEEMARRLRFFSAQITKEKDIIPIRSLQNSAPLIMVGPRAAQTIDELDVTFSEHESRLLQMNESYQTLSERTKELLEARHVLRETAVFFNRVFLFCISNVLIQTCAWQAEDQQVEVRRPFDDSSAPLLQHEDREQQFSTTSIQFELEYVCNL